MENSQELDFEQFAPMSILSITKQSQKMTNNVFACRFYVFQRSFRK